MAFGAKLPVMKLARPVLNYSKYVSNIFTYGTGINNVPNQTLQTDMRPALDQCTTDPPHEPYGDTTQHNDTLIYLTDKRTDLERLITLPTHYYFKVH